MPVIHGIVVDCTDAEKVAAFWREALGYEVRHRGEGWVSLRRPDGEGPFLSFDTVPEKKVVKNRVHLDIRPTERTREEERERLESLGARVVRLVDDNPQDVHYIMADPEGNEFCVLEPF
jgi:catechol 2,3-dioxygenase-like lactoylglutathione lyase family enzyme